MTKLPAKLPDKQAHRALALRAAATAEQVLPHFEIRHPEDDGPRQAIAAGRAWARGELTVAEARRAAHAAHAAARDAEHPAARFAARAAGHAAATAHVAGHARHANEYAAKAAAAAGEPKNDHKIRPQKLAPGRFSTGCARRWRTRAWRR